MAIQTPKAYRNQVMYSIYVRNHTPEGTFQALRKDLRRISDLGVDIIWLMPIHPIGTRARKGSLGSPYAISDYRAVNPEYGTLEDFQALVADIHALGMKCIIDVVYNHTSPDSVLVREHPQWFYRKPDGSFGNHVGDWTDIVDLDYRNRELWDYQIETLKYWATMVDGFRCDVAPMIPVEFWQAAREAVETVRPGCFWLSESIEPQFITYLRSQGLVAHTDAEIYQAFDVAYDYDIYGIFRSVLKGERPLSDYAEALNRQETLYPENYVKLRYLENHDQDRAADIIPDEDARRHWTAFVYFIKGMTLLYGGQEVADAHRPGLFDRDTVNWNTGKDITPFLRRLSEIKRDMPANSRFFAQALPGDVLLVQQGEEGGRMLTGIFSARGGSAEVAVSLPDGQYRNLIDGETVSVAGGKIQICHMPLILET